MSLLVEQASCLFHFPAVCPNPGHEAEQASCLFHFPPVVFPGIFLSWQ
ncbi:MULTISPECIES: hypothetical protein [unclassified Moorena]|nr:MULTISPECIES: hypothetical protein [unclassified Moorena]NEQ12177.1 hypothetical protein [Moorena sp. SIO4E2]NEQ14582.1 hypothetical protein [Moorena sp. SIO3E2]NER85959.1 hypothetical protein [Moorena sp. SIO3A2]